MNDYKTLKELTPSQKEKAEKITQLILELQKSGVYPLIIDGGGGSGLEFIRCSKEERFLIGEELLNHPNSEVSYFIYSPKNFYNYNVDVLVP